MGIVGFQIEINFFQYCKGHHMFEMLSTWDLQFK
jgi:hypothetical protein